jgi:hypothetical protein
MKSIEVAPGMARIERGSATEDAPIIKKARELVSRHCPERLADFDGEMTRLYSAAGVKEVPDGR